MLLALGGGQLPAQAPHLTVPQASPKAEVGQTVGLTEIRVTYGRPAVQGRAIWGGLVPYDKVWRAGANDNTVVTFSTPVKVGGMALAAGSYGLHMVPARAAWTVIFSNQAHAWGSFTYDAKEDAARVTVTPVPAEASERLAYTFDDPTENTVVLSLRWEHLRVPIPIEVETKAVVVAHLRDQLRGLPQFFHESWANAADWCVKHDVNLVEALVWADHSLAMKESFLGFQVKAALLEKSGDAKGAAALQAKALALATEIELNNYGYTLLAQGRVEAALALFQKNVADHPESWNTYDSLAEAYATKGEKAKAIEYYTKAYEKVKAEDQRARIQGELTKLR